MSHDFPVDSTTWAFLERIDEDLAARIKTCPHCGGNLHAASYPRKPRGVERSIVDGARRLSFCCAGCRRRVTPPSVRYFGRRVYVAFVFVFLTALSQGKRSPEFRSVVDRLGIDKRTLQRWRRWWRETFVETSLWRKLRTRFPKQPTTLPLSLVGMFSDPVVLLQRLSPLTSKFGDGAPAELAVSSN